jgi:hypothetical protein
MPRPELIFLHSVNGDGCNARELCKGGTFEHDARSTISFGYRMGGRTHIHRH